MGETMKLNGLFDGRPSCPICKSSEKVSRKFLARGNTVWHCFREECRLKLFDTPEQSHFISCPICSGQKVLQTLRFGPCRTCKDRGWVRL